MINSNVGSFGVPSVKDAFMSNRNVFLSTNKKRSNTTIPTRSCNLNLHPQKHIHTKIYFYILGLNTMYVVMDSSSLWYFHSDFYFYFCTLHVSGRKCVTWPPPRCHSDMMVTVLSPQSFQCTLSLAVYRIILNWFCFLWSKKQIDLDIFVIVNLLWYTSRYTYCLPY